MSILSLLKLSVGISEHVSIRGAKSVQVETVGDIPLNSEVLGVVYSECCWVLNGKFPDVECMLIEQKGTVRSCQI